MLNLEKWVKHAQYSELEFEFSLKKVSIFNVKWVSIKITFGDGNQWKKSLKILNLLYKIWILQWPYVFSKLQIYLHMNQNLHNGLYNFSIVANWPYSFQALQIDPHIYVFFFQILQNCSFGPNFQFHFWTTFLLKFTFLP